MKKRNSIDKQAWQIPCMKLKSIMRRINKRILKQGVKTSFVYNGDVMITREIYSRHDIKEGVKIKREETI